MIRRYYLVKDFTTGKFLVMLRNDFKDDFFKYVIDGFNNNTFRVIKVY